MKREQLKELGLTDEQINKVMAAHGETVNAMKDDIAKIDAYKTQLEEKEAQIKERDKQLEEISGKAQGNEALQEQIKQLQEQNKTTQTEYEQKLQKQQFDFALEKNLTGAKVKNPKAVKALLDMDTIKLDGDNLKGLDEQLKAIRETDGYLFAEEESAKPKFTTGDHQKTETTDVDAWKAAFAPPTQQK